MKIKIMIPRPSVMAHLEEKVRQEYSHLVMKMQASSGPWIRHPRMFKGKRRALVYKYRSESPPLPLLPS